MVDIKYFGFILLILSVLKTYETATIPILELRRTAQLDLIKEAGEDGLVPAELIRPRVREGVPPPLCSAGRCAAPLAPAGPVCAFNARGTARTFATLCELEAVSCKESTYYAISSLGEC